MIPTERVKSIDYLFNRIISERVRGSLEPKYALLLGAGCSVSSGIESAGGVINMLKSIAYLRELPTRTTSTPFLELEYGRLVPFLEKWYERNKNDADFLKFVQEHQVRIENKVVKEFSDPDEEFRDSDEEFRDSDEYYEELFREIIRKKYPKYEEKSGLERHKILEELLKENIENVVTDRTYSYWFSQYSTSSEDIHSFLTELMNNKNPSEAYIFLADLFINHMFSVAFTTNFDNLMGEALSLLGVRSKEILFDANGIDDTLSKTSPNIIKLHGDYMYNNTKNLFSETRKLSSPLQRQLESVLSKCGLIVIGYAGADNSIMYALERISEKFSFPLFWCEMESKIRNDKIHWRAKKLVMKSENAYFVPIESFDSLIEKLRQCYLYYAKLRKEVMNDRGEKDSIMLYDDEYLTEALKRIKNIIDKVIDQNKKVSTEVNPVPPPMIKMVSD